MAPHARSADPTDPNDPTHPIRTPRLGLLLGAVVFAVAALTALTTLAAPAGPAAATEFGSNPSASAFLTCDGNGGYAAYTLRNVNGNETAHFTVALTGSADVLVDVAPNATPPSESVPLQEGESYTLTITATGGFSLVESVDPVDCFSSVGTIVLVCDDSGPSLEATHQQSGNYPTTISFAHDGLVETSEEYDHTFTAALAEDAPFTASLTSAQDGTLATLAGTADCAPPVTATTTTTTTTSTTVPETTTTTSTTVPETTTTTSTTVPETTTSTTAPETTTTAVPETTTTVPETTTTTVPETTAVPETTTTSVAPVAAPGVPPTPSGPQVGGRELAAPVPVGPLPRTGSNAGLLAAIGTTLLGVGVVLRRLAIRSDRSVGA